MGYMDFAIIKCTYKKLNLPYQLKVKKLAKTGNRSIMLIMRI